MMRSVVCQLRTYVEYMGAVLSAPSHPHPLPQGFGYSFSNVCADSLPMFLQVICTVYWPCCVTYHNTFTVITTVHTVQ